MFVHAPVATPPFVEPWAASLDARLQALDGRGLKVAYFYEVPDATTFRYRVHNMIEVLRARPGRDVLASWFCLADLARCADALDRADVIVLCRSRYAVHLATIVLRARARGARVLYDCDDLVFDPARAHEVLQSIGADAGQDQVLDGWFAKMARYGALMRLCDGVVVTNPALAREVEAGGLTRDVRIVPNFLGQAQQAVSRALFEAKRQAGFQSDGTITIGYFSGSLTHGQDFAIAAGALARLLRAEPRMRLRLVGHLEVPAALAAHAARIEVLPVQTFIDLQALVAGVEVNIVPLQDTAFTRCKSELKVFEAAIVGTVSVASRVGTLAGAIRPGETGFLAYAHQWDGALADALALAGDPARYATAASLAVAEAEAAYGCDRQGATVERAVLTG